MARVIVDCVHLVVDPGVVVEIRAFERRDWGDVWPTVEDVIVRGDTFTYDPDLSQHDAQRMWIVPPPGRVTVAVDDDDVVGTSNMYANRAGPGSHIASGSLMVGAHARNLGVGRELVNDMLRWARSDGFEGVQFNAVAASNEAAVHLYQQLGFDIVGTVPGAFAHPRLGRVGLHVMFHNLEGVIDDEAQVG